MAIVGPPNAGKSTLANRLIGRDRVIASDTPGTTRDWVSETALIRGWPVLLTDTAGIRPTDCAIEAEAIRRGRDKARAADLVVVVLDATSSASEQATALKLTLASVVEARPLLIVLNKCDLVPSERPDTISKTAERPALGISALAGDGLEGLEAGIEKALGLDRLDYELPTAFLPIHITAS